MRRFPIGLTSAVIGTTALGVCVVGLGLSLVGCERKPKQGSTTAPADEGVLPPTVKPEYSFAPGLEETYPEVAGFLRSFLETALVGDYAKYRRLVARSDDPVSKARFEKILQSLRRLDVDSIEQVTVRGVAPPVYLVITRPELDPAQKVALRRDNSRVGIFVLKEEGEWRMLPAPGDFQPRATSQASSATSTSRESTETQPSFPWDQGTDY